MLRCLTHTIASTTLYKFLKKNKLTLHREGQNRQGERCVHKIIFQCRAHLIEGHLQKVHLSKIHSLTQVQNQFLEMTFLLLTLLNLNKLFQRKLLILMIVQSKIDNNHLRNSFNESLNPKAVRTKQLFHFKIKRKRSERTREPSLQIQYSV